MFFFESQTLIRSVTRMQLPYHMLVNIQLHIFSCSYPSWHSQVLTMFQ